MYGRKAVDLGMEWGTMGGHISLRKLQRIAGVIVLFYIFQTSSGGSKCDRFTWDNKHLSTSL